MPLRLFAAAFFFVKFASQVKFLQSEVALQ
jgi:hypothetical protein